ncbi:MAG: FAD-binding protein [Myxococcales bacterium]|nr:FAD-binding protein [Myxococcales bacterium]
MSTILIVAEQKEGALRGATLNAIDFARKLAAERSADIAAVVIGDSVGSAAEELAKYVPRVLAAEDSDLEHYMAETYAPVVVAAVEATGADVIVATATATGKDLLPRCAALLECAMTADVSGIVDGNTFKRPLVAGNAIGTVQISTDRFIVSIRQAEWDAAQPSGSAGNVESLGVGAVETKGAEVLRIDAVESERPELTEANVVISGGRGMKTGENFAYLEKLADVFGGAMGATRAACDAGLVPNDLQVGQTGKVVAPDLYIAVGISGAIQHLAGMKGSKVIVAINKDPEAPIFQVADYGLVAKWEDTVEDLTAKIAAIKAG